ncbi:MAG TPA: hypothetical protein VL614_02605 [Acetobacteraceae bacterium]|jgi:hypothetical protein|nr:hypothetical protein [Acetobacteraceae bacterium]
MSGTSTTPQPRSMRLIFEYEGDEVRLVMQQPVDLPATAAPPTQQTGFFVETRDAADRTLSRLAAHGAYPDSVEVFPERHGDPITRVQVDRPRGAFTIIVPASQDTDHVRLVQVTAPPGDVAQPATRTFVQPQGALQEREIARFPLQIGR